MARLLLLTRIDTHTRLSGPVRTVDIEVPAHAHARTHTPMTYTPRGVDLRLPYLGGELLHPRADIGRGE